MPSDSLLLSGLILGLLLIEISLYQRADTNFLQRGRQITISKQTLAVLIASTVVFFSWVGYVYVYHAGPAELQTFYLAIYTALWLMNGIFFLRIQNLRRRLALSTVIAFAITTLVLLFPSQLLQNLIMVGALLWIGPVVANLARRLTPLWTSLGLSLFAILDAYTVSHEKLPQFSDKDFIMNGLVTVGDFYLGIGDFFLGFITLSLTQRFFGRKSAIILAILFPIPRLFIRILVPSLAGQAVPYSIFMVVPTLILYMILSIRHQNRRHYA